MKKVLTIMLTFLAILLIAGCVSIPLTDGGTLEISGDGITIIPDESEGMDEEADAAETEKEGGSIESGDNDGVDNNIEDEESSEIEGEQAADGENEDFGEVEGFGGCGNEFYLAVNRLPKDFPIPPCAPIKHFELLADFDENTRDLIIHFDNYGALTEVHEAFKTFLSSAGFTISSDTLNDINSNIVASGNGIELTINNLEMGQDEIVTDVHYKETPIKQYDVVDSIINQTGNGHGKCSDEYYTLLGMLTPDFPMPECVDVSFIQIANTNGITQGAGAYFVGGVWAQSFEKYQQYAKDKNYEITHESGQATQGGLDFQSDELSLAISIENVTQFTRSKVQINFGPSF